MSIACLIALSTFALVAKAPVQTQTVRVLVLNFDPIITQEGGKTAPRGIEMARSS